MQRNLILCAIFFLSNQKSWAGKVEPDPRPFCGRSNVDSDSRIINGDIAEPNAWPWMANIYMVDQNLTYALMLQCGASLYDEYHVITAAHCVNYKMDLSLYYIHLGNHHRWAIDEGEETRQVQDVYFTTGDKASEMELGDFVVYGDNDIAIIRLDRPVKYTRAISPICLPSEEVTGGENVTVTGWGTTHGTTQDLLLNQVTVPIVPRDVCNQDNSYNGTITENMICAAFMEGGYDSCQGDSGGPLFRRQTGEDRYVLQGIVSWGMGCAEPMYPGVYTNVINYVDWIKEAVKESNIIYTKKIADKQ